MYVEDGPGVETPFSVPTRRGRAPAAGRLPRGRTALCVALTGASLAVWASWQLTRHFPHPWGDLSRGVYTDHFSHMNAARVFPRAGLNLWRRPIASMFRPLTPDEMTRVPPDVHLGGSWSGGVFSVRRWPADKPLVLSWSNIPRPYPPGDLLLVAPIAILYHYSALSLAGANRLLLTLFLVYAHVALYLFFSRMLTDGLSRSPGALLALFIVYAETLHWTLEGFYDAAAIAPLVVCASYLARRRGLAALVAYSVAACIHYRAYFLAPWAIYAVILIVSQREWTTWTRRHWIALGAAAVMAAISIGTFALVLPALRTLPVNNPIALSHAEPYRPVLIGFLCVSAVAAAALIAADAWLDLAVLGWMAVMMFQSPFISAWYLLVPLAWLGSPAFGASRARAALVADARVVFLLGTGALVFGNPMLPTWLVQLFR